MTARAFSAADLAGQPAMPSSKRGVHLLAQREGWRFVELFANGGTRRLYLADQLPAATRAALAANSPMEGAGRVEGARVALRAGLEQRAASARRQSALRHVSELNAGEQARMDARLSVLRAFEIWSADGGLPAAQARIGFALAYNDGGVAVSAEVRALVPRVSDSTLERWQREVRTRGIAALAGSYGNRAGSGKVDRQVGLREFVQAMLVEFPHARATHVAQALRARLPGAELPSTRSLERWINTWREGHAEILQAITNPDAWKNKHMVAFGSASEGVERVNQRWELDSSPADVMLTDGRHSLIGVVDVASRRARLLVSRTSKAAAVAALLRAALLAWGVPEEAKTDNGSDYTSNHIVRVFAALDVTHTLCPPFQPWHKPHIERFFGTFARDLVELMPGYIGHSVAERSAIEARRSFADRLMTRNEVVDIAMDSRELQAACDRWTEQVYMHNPHDGLDGRTPFEAAAGYLGELRRITDERALDVLLAEAPENNGRRTVQKKGIRLDDAWFIAPELEAWVGRQVQVRYDEVQHDLGRVFVFGGDTLRFICLAECPERTGMDRREVALKAKAMQTKRVQDERRALKAAARRQGTDRVVDEILRDRATAAGKLSALPRPAVEHTSDGLAAAAEAAASFTRPKADIEQLLSVEAARARLLVEAERVPAGTPNPLAAERLARKGGIDTPDFASRQERVQWLLRQALHRELGGEEREYLAAYKREFAASFRRMQELVDEQASLRSPKEEDPGRLDNGTGSI